jgi:sortase A
MNHTPLKHHNQQNQSQLSGSIDIGKATQSYSKPEKTHADTVEYLKVLFMRTLGNFLVLSSLFLIGKTFYQPIREEARYFVESQLNKVYVVEGQEATVDSPEEPGGLAAMFDIDQVEVLVPNDPNFSVVVPKIGANAPVVPNVNAADEQAYLDALHDGVAHVSGTAFPGEGGHIFLFAHSTDYVWNVGSYNAVFYLLYKLENGDEVNLFHEGKRYVYEVTGSKIVDPSEVEYITRKTETEFVTLQTCWPPGTTLKRLLVFAERKDQ